ncbi:SDR family NAD(P)-dependent oxidoreductase [Streptomyces alkaliterrae]|uniref:SDR family oxidoreductase n=1 Tax=Streptomyces alkaliterrae TaxID=2213162 RepID=A0A5P0YKU5_9ACTN|nr:SDR family NAD(P)-dependent oxidoreductase [Streptomyces alkaliterrae]MBB1253295.1 SDR family oxidoreductase [Streptomyces alkaliterrae]MBB1259581.1 SDR family oxidoreductase [Streptomyces alkaliterrae]MQS00993.1 SDR family oxidoreductase [Streptomyces alkaliterrae]
MTTAFVTAGAAGSPAATKDQVAVVIGGGRGIGAAVVEALATGGRRVVVADTDHLPSEYNHYRSHDVGGHTEARALAERLTDSGLDVTAEAADAGDERAVARLYDRISAEYGRLDVVVNAFGVTHVRPVEEMELAEFRHVVQGNLDGVFLSSRHALPLLRATGGGAIVNFSSVSGRSGFAKVAHYCAAKFGVVGFTAALAQEVARDGIRVNAVCPGIVRSNMWRYLLEEFTRPGESEDECWERMRGMIPQREFQTAEDIAQLVVFLAEARRVTGQAVSVDGGMTAP